jgi:hypothetical protein
MYLAQTVKRSLLCLFHSERSPSLLKSYRLSHSFFYFIFFLATFTFQAQQLSHLEQKSLPTLTLTKGAAIYSIDNALNEQILTGKIVIQNSEISFLRDIDNNKVLVKASFKGSKNGITTLKDQLMIAENKKQKDDLKKVEKEIEKHKARTNYFSNLSLIYLPAQNQHFSSRSIKKSYFAPAHNTNKDYKSHIADHTNVIFSSLSSSNSKEHFFYNTKSLQNSFSKIFPVRPPPTFSSAA